MPAESPSLLPELLRPEFFRDRVWPLLARAGGAPPPPFVEARVAQRSATGRVTVEYRLGEETSLFAKGYGEGEQGLASHDLLRAARESGFGAGSPYRVPAPLGYLPECRLLLTEAAPGECLAALQKLGREAWEEGVLGAARWLAAFHACPLRLGPREDARRDLLRLGRHLVAAAARRPEAQQQLVFLLREVASRAAAAPPPRPVVQLHGRYHSGHVFVAPGIVTCIDLDRAGPGDPARDVAEFLHRLQTEVRKGRLESEWAEAAPELFVREYSRHSSADLSALGFYWSCHALEELLRPLRKERLGKEDPGLYLAFHQAEFRALGGRLEALAR